MHNDITNKFRPAGLLAVIAMLVLGSCSIRHRAPRKEGLGCVAYEFVYRSAHLGGQEWAPPEFSGMNFLAGSTSRNERTRGEYAVCPRDAQEPDPQLVKLWRQWRADIDRKQFSWYGEEVQSEVVTPLALQPQPPHRTRSIEGALFRFTTYRAYFQGCEYWATWIKNTVHCSPTK